MRSSQRSAFRLGAVGVCFLTLAAFSGKTLLSQTGGAASPSITFFKVSKDPDFHGYRTLLRQWNESHPQAAGSDFCVLGYAAGDGTRAAWVLWPQGEEIFHWEGGPAPLDSLATIHLKTDVVNSEEEVAGSTHLVTKAWVSQLQATCKRNGTQLHLPPSH